MKMGCDMATGCDLTVTTYRGTSCKYGDYARHVKAQPAKQRTLADVLRDLDAVSRVIEGLKGLGLYVADSVRIRQAELLDQASTAMARAGAKGNPDVRIMHEGKRLAWNYAKCEPELIDAPKVIDAADIPA